MRLDNVLKVLLLIIISTELYAQDFYTYKLFDNKFQVVFPGKPSIQQIPKELLNPQSIENSFPYEYKKQLTKRQIKKIVSDTIIQMKNSQPYIYVDRMNQLSFTAQSTPSHLEHKNYIWHGIKQLLDNLIKKGLKVDNQRLIDFSSSLDKKKDTYIAIYTSTYIMDGKKVYSSTKQIYYKDRTYKWHVGYVNQNNKKIFDKYRQYCKIMN